MQNLRTSLAAVLVGAAALSGAAGCRTSTEPVGEPDGPPSRATTIGPLSLEVAVDRSTLSPSDTLRATVTVENASGAPVTVWGSGSCTLDVILRDARGQPLEDPRQRVCTMDLRSFTFAPGRTTALTRRIAASYWSNAQQRTVALPPGSYQVVAILDGTTDTSARPPEGRVAAESAPVGITVTR